MGRYMRPGEGYVFAGERCKKAIAALEFIISCFCRNFVYDVDRKEEAHSCGGVQEIAEKSITVNRMQKK